MTFLEKVRAELRSLVLVNKYNDGTFSFFIRVPIKIKSSHLLSWQVRNKEIVPNKIVFDNYMGKGYGCNPKYVAEKLEELYPGRYDMVWLVSRENYSGCNIPKHIRVVEYESPEAMEEYATAKVWVSNYHKIAFTSNGLYKRRGQYFIQMWHGSLGIKKIENDAAVLTKERNWLKQAKFSSSMVDFWISNSSFENDIYKRAFWKVTDNKILQYGHPRNDVFFGEQNGIKKKVSDYFKILDCKIAIYAPTFREDGRLDVYDIDYKNLRNSLEKRFGGIWAILVRLHPRLRYFSRELVQDNEAVYDATFYEDIQELLAASDCLITDYSSCMFDFMLTKRPAFIFATDIEDYNNERGFYYPLEDTPFPIATNNTELSDKIKNFNADKYLDDVEKFLIGKGCIEDGKASDRVAELIAKITME